MSLDSNSSLSLFNSLELVLQCFCLLGYYPAHKKRTERATCAARDTLIRAPHTCFFVLFSSKRWKAAICVFFFTVYISLFISLIVCFIFTCLFIDNQRLMGLITHITQEGAVCPTHPLIICRNSRGGGSYRFALHNFLHVSGVTFSFFDFLRRAPSTFSIVINFPSLCLARRYQSRVYICDLLAASRHVHITSEYFRNKTP